MPLPKASLNTLWQSAPTTTESVFQPVQTVTMPKAAQRYFAHAIAPNTQLATAVRLKMQGEIKLKGWHSFRAEQVICAHRGMLWQATVWMKGLPIFGWDRLIEGDGAMQWKLLGLLPLAKARGSDITRSAVGRMQGEYAWLPSALLDQAVKWTAVDETHICAELSLCNETTHLKLTLNETGRLQEACFKRWGDPGESTPHYENFGVLVEDEGTFSGYTIPTRVRAGWYFGSDRFETEGDFFHATIDEAIYR
ncbi:MAG: DUF6544 family protein [Cyanobacteria bacterium J06634_5]